MQINAEDPLPLLNSPSKEILGGAVNQQLASAKGLTDAASFSSARGPQRPRNDNSPPPGLCAKAAGKCSLGRPFVLDPIYRPRRGRRANYNSQKPTREGGDGLTERNGGGVSLRGKKKPLDKLGRRK